MLSVLSPAAEFIEAERCKRPEQSKARSERKQKWKHGIAQDGSGQDEAEHRVNQTQDDRVARYSLEVFPASPKCIVQVGQADCSNDRRSSLLYGRCPFRQIARIRCSHATVSLRHGHVAN